MSKDIAKAQVFGEYTGGALPAGLVKKAREEEVTMMDVWGVWEVIAREGTWRLTGKNPLKGRVGWVAARTAGACAMCDAGGPPRRSPTTAATSSSRRLRRLRP